MAKRLKIYTDGARNDETKVAGWGFVIVAGDAVLYAECGQCEGSAMAGEYLAIIHGLLTLPRSTKLQLVVDLDEIENVVADGEWGKSKKKQITAMRKLVCQLAAQHDMIVKVVKSSSHPFNKYADTLARRACGLEPKAKNEAARQRRRDAAGVL